MKIGQLSDLHYCQDFLDEVDRCTSVALAGAIDAKCEIIAITGDEIDHHLDAHAPAFLALAKRLRNAADHVPLIVLQGTFSHDVPGTVGLFRLLGGRFPIHVSERIEQVAWNGEDWIASEGFRFDEIPAGTKVLFTSIPSVNQADIVARVGSDGEPSQTMDLVAELLAAFGAINDQARAAGIPTVLLSHGTVSGSVTEHGVPMAGLDHEFSTGSLFSARASAVMLGHIHRHQSWERDGRRIAYAGSIGRLHFGEQGDKGWVEWDVDADAADLIQRATPARTMMEFDYPGLPDMEELTLAAQSAAGAHVRIRYVVDEEHRQAVDRKAIQAAFASAAQCKIDPHINPVLRARTSGIARLPDLPSKLTAWAKATNTQPDGLVERLALLDLKSPDEIVAEILNPVALPSSVQEAA